MVIKESLSFRSAENMIDDMMSQNLSSAAVVIGAFRVKWLLKNHYHSILQKT